jgi:hypothetical protein
MRHIVALCLSTIACFAFAQVDYDSLELRIEGCKSNLPIYFHKCITNDEKGAKYSEAQIGKAIRSCNVVAWNKFFDCTGLYPKPTITEQIESEIN